MNKLIILDRDGVINHDSHGYIKSPEEWHPIPGSLEAIAALNARGITVVVATNQSGLARGFYDQAMLEKIHEKMHRYLRALGGKIEQIFYCPHGPEDGCLCRKPKPGLLQQIASAYGISLQDVPFVGDSMRDIQAALRAGAIPVLVLSGNGQKTKTQYANELQGIACFENLAQFSRSF